MNKKLVGVVLVLALVVVMLTGCTEAPKEVKVFKGLGNAIAFRVGPGADSETVPVYSFNVVVADVTFDAAGKILDSTVDILEVSTPNYDGEGMPHFPGWPGTVGYNNTDHATEKVVGKADTSVEAVAKEVNGWLTKRERGDNYHMNPKNEWYKQMDWYESFFKGKTVAELEAIFAKSFSDRNGRPLDPKTTNEVDLAKANKLTDAEKTAVTDIRTHATMSLRDPHGDILGALKDAFEKKVEISIPIPAAK